jgi:hypothetical protein
MHRFAGDSASHLETRCLGTMPRISRTGFGNHSMMVIGSLSALNMVVNPGVGMSVLI